MWSLWWQCRRWRSCCCCYYCYWWWWFSALYYILLALSSSLFGQTKTTFNMYVCNKNFCDAFIWKNANRKNWCWSLRALRLIIIILKTLGFKFDYSVFKMIKRNQPHPQQRHQNHHRHHHNRNQNRHHRPYDGRLSTIYGFLYNP